MKRIIPIEGLRAYLALWVVLGHSLDFCYGRDAINQFTGLPKLLCGGVMAVSLFMALSGFVIFGLLDQRRENYWQFIVRRFFRIYPVYIILLFGGLALAPAFGLVIAHHWPDWNYTPWVDWPWKVGLHLLLLHGIAPHAWLGYNSDESYLIPAWSLSLEWQFYLVAPLIFWALNRCRWSRFTVFAICLGLIYMAAHVLSFDGFLPVRIDFFFYGIAGYYLHKSGLLRLKTADIVFPVTVVISLLMFMETERSRAIIPLAFWLMFFALLQEPEDSVSARIILPAFTNRVAQYLGKISYGIYLSHYLVLIGFEYAFLHFLPNLTNIHHFVFLVTGALPATIAVSALLHHFVEVPGMALGRRFANARRLDAEPIPSDG